MDFSSSLTLDKYGNTVTVLGNPTLSNGKYVGDGTGDGLKCTTITSLGSDKWCIEGKFKFNNTNSSMMLFRSKTTFGLGLYRNASNKLELLLSSNGSSFDIANTVLGTKADWSTSTEYYLKLKFTGSAYIVSWSTDGITYTDDLTVTSSLIVANITALLFGIDYNESSLSLNGTMDDIRVTIGNIRADGEAFTADAYWYDTANKIMKYGSPASWTELSECVALGEVTTNASAVVSAVSYPLNDEHGKGFPDYSTAITVTTPNGSVYKVPYSGYLIGYKTGGDANIKLRYKNSIGMDLVNIDADNTSGSSFCIPVSADDDIYFQENSGIVSIVKAKG
jgi:hypothetical protein